MAPDVIIREVKTNAGDMGAIASMINTALATGGDVVKELIRTAQTNPLVGIFLVYLLVDMASTTKIGTDAQNNPIYMLHGDSVAALKLMIAASAGITITAQIVDAIGNLVPSLDGAKASPASIITPTATTLVNANNDRIDPASAAELGSKK